MGSICFTGDTHVLSHRNQPPFPCYSQCLQTAMFVYPLRLLRPALVEKLLDFGMRPLFRAVQISASTTVTPWLQPPKCEPCALLTARRLEVETQTSPIESKWIIIGPSNGRSI